MSSQSTAKILEKKGKIFPGFQTIFWGKTTISNASISRRVFRKPLGGRVRVVDGQVGQVRLG